VNGFSCEPTTDVSKRMTITDGRRLLYLSTVNWKSWVFHRQLAEEFTTKSTWPSVLHLALDSELGRAEKESNLIAQFQVNHQG
jgi:hypothetical protein